MHIESDRPAFLSSVDSIASDIAKDRSAPLAALRKDALKHFEALGVPTPKNEDWKYTSLQSLSRTEFRVGATPDTVTATDLEPLFIPGADIIRLVFINGVFSKESSSPMTAEGAVVMPLREALGNKDEAKLILDRHFGKILNYREHAFAAFNTALLGEGVYVRALKGKVVAQPIQLIFVSTRGHTASILPVRNFICAEQGAQLRVIETFAGLGENLYLTSAVTEVFCERESVIDHTKVQVESRGAYHMATLGVKQEDGSKFSSHVFSFGGELARNEIHPVLAGENIECLMNGLTVINGEQHVDNTTVLDHAKPNCFSRELYKGIYNDRSSGVFSGTIIVRQDAQKTNAIQSNQTLLLSDEASIDTRPQLKIYADDVKCTHGATIGQLDAAAMFYLRSRGIGKADARNMLIHAFASDIIAYVPLAALREQLERRLMTQLGEEEPQQLEQ